MNTNSIKTAVALALTLGFASAHAADIKSDKEGVNAACVQDAATAGCGSEVVGKGLLKCLHTYKKAHKDYKFSEGCKSAMKTLHADKKEMKKEKN